MGIMADQWLWQNFIIKYNISEFDFNVYCSIDISVLTVLAINLYQVIFRDLFRFWNMVWIATAWSITAIHSGNWPGNCESDPVLNSILTKVSEVTLFQEDNFQAGLKSILCPFWNCPSGTELLKTLFGTEFSTGSFLWS